MLNSEKKTILIVDDDQELRETLAFLLKRNFNVLTASDGKEGLLLYSSNPSLSLMLVDLCMPVMDGIEMLSRLREAGDDIKVLVITGYCNYDWVAKCADLNIQGYLQKPFTPDELLAKIKKVLRINECTVLREFWGEEYGSRMSKLSETVKHVISHIKDNLHSDLQRTEICSELKISPDYLSRIFSGDSGIKLQEYINRCSVEKSIEHLESFKKKRIDEVAKLVGFQDSNYFARVFKEYKGVTPVEYKNR